MKRQSKKVDNKKILYVYTGDHPVHKKFADMITKNSVKLSRNLPKNFDIYFFEGAYVLPAMLKVFRLLGKGKKIITLFADPRLYYLDRGICFNYKTNKIKKMSILRRRLSYLALKQLDGAICEGSMNKELLSKVNAQTPIEVVYPFIWNERYKELSRIKPDLKSQKIVFIGNGPDAYCKGIDLLIDVFKEVKKDFCDAELHIVGADWNVKRIWKTEGVFFEGSQNIIDYLKKSSLLIHLGQGEGFGINVLEALLAGIPTLVSEGTGAKDVVSKVDKSFVLPLSKDKIVKKIGEYFRMDLKDKEDLSKKAKIIAKEYNEDKMLKNFQIKFNELLDEIK